MAEWLIPFGKANLALALGILLVLALRPLASRWFGARIAYGLWLLPVMAAAASLLPARVRFVEVVAAPTPVWIGGPVPVVETAQQTSAGPDLWLLLGGLWAAGLLAALLRLLMQHRRALDDAARGQIGPAVVGVIAPRIVKPRDFADRFTPEEQHLVLAHEDVHLTRQDARANGLLAVVQCLCWFNPLVHIGARFLRIDQELACDEAVISRFPKARTAYARALAKAQLAIRPLPLGCYWPSGTRHPLLMRITMINRDSLTRARRLSGAAALLLLTAATGVTAWAAQPQRAVPVPAPSQTQSVGTPVRIGPAPAQGESTVRIPLPARAPTARTEAAPAPGQICVTNSCADMAKVKGDRAALDAAIKAGDVRGVLTAGGSASDTMQAIIKQNEMNGRPKTDLTGRTLAERLAPGTEQFVTGPRGNLALGFQLQGGGHQVIATPDMAGFAPPADAPDAAQMAGQPRGSTPITVPGEIQPNGAQPARIVGWNPPAAAQ